MRSKKKESLLYPGVVHDGQYAVQVVQPTLADKAHNQLHSNDAAYNAHVDLPVPQVR